MNRALVLILTAILLSGCAQLESWRGSSEAARASEPSRVTSRVVPFERSPSTRSATANVEEDEGTQALIFPGTDAVVNLPPVRPAIQLSDQAVTLNFEAAPLTEVVHSKQFFP